MKIFLSFLIILDIAIVSWICYKLLTVVRKTRGFQLIVGIAAIFLLTAVTGEDMLKLTTLNFLLENTVQVGLIAVIVLLQPEIRAAISKIGNRTISSFFSEIKTDEAQAKIIASKIKEACLSLSEMGHGALIAIERNISVEDVTKGGTVINSDISPELLVNIFIPNTPLHDGAVVISGHTIKKAAAVLPLCQDEGIAKELGTRHRAGVGLSELTDAFVIIVSEETSKISVAFDGTLTRNLTESALDAVLIKALSRDEEINVKIRKFLRRTKNEAKS